VRTQSGADEQQEHRQPTYLRLPLNIARTALWATVLACLAEYALYSLAGVGRGSLDNLNQQWLAQIIQLGAAALCVLRAVRDRRERKAWLCLAAGMTLSAAGDLYYAIALAGLAEPPFPSWADALWISFYPLVYAAVLLLVRARAGRFHTSLSLDGAIAGLGFATVAAAVLLQPIIDSTGGGTAAVVVNLAYPCGDLLILIVVMVGSALLGWRVGRGWLALAAALVLSAVADSFYLYQVAKGTYVEGHWLDFAWPLAAVLFAAASALPARRADTSEPARDLWLLLVPLLFTIAATGVLILDHFQPVSTIAVALAAATLVAALLRTAFTFREVRALYDSRRLALTDDLTGLANRRAFYDRVHAALEGPRAGTGETTLLVIDLDRFKELNDTLGHYAGDLLLHQVGPRLIDAVPDADTVARLGGDEFAVLLLGEMGEARARRAAVAIKHTLEQSFEVDGVTVHVEASIGIALSPEHGDETGPLLQRADTAMYRAKALRSGHEVYNAEEDGHSRDRLALLGELRDAIDRDELVVLYQPKADMRSARVNGAEALVRWQHPRRGLLLPQDFLPMAEQTTLMRPLTLFVLATALRQARTWHDAGRPFTIAVNLAAPNLFDLDLPGDVSRLLAETGVDPRFLVLEITENIVMTDPIRAIAVLRELRALGVELSLDDFGTGYSSLAYLKKLAVAELKIDKSFVMHMADDEDDATIVRSTVELARNLNLRIVAEGVEDERSWRALEAMGCAVAQGYFLSKPVSAAQFDAWLADWRLTPAFGDFGPSFGLGLDLPVGS
jgi:diguanylate cyclase (GGDEF)-like protein